MEKKTKVRIILPGGGVKGAFQLGALSVILGSGRFEVDAVYGCSVGAILAPLIAAGNVAKITEIFNGIKSIDDVVERRTLWGMIPYPDWPVVQGLATLVQLGAYKSIKLVDVAFQNITAAELLLAKQRCHVVAYDILSNTERWFTGAELKDGVKCSSALWLAVPPVSYGGTLYSDGGATEVFPVTYILNHDIQEPFDGVYIFVDCDARTPFTNAVPGDGLTLMSCLQWGAATRLAEYELAKLQTQLGASLYLVRPTANLLSSALDINPERMKATYDAGVAKGALFLQSCATY